MPSLKFVGDVVAGNLALLVVASAGAERVPQAALGELRVGRRRRDVDDAVVGIDFRRRDRDARVEVTNHELDAVADELVGDRDALLRIGDVVADLELDLLAIDAAGCVDVGGSRSAPFCNCAPNAAFGPVIGPATPIRMSAHALPLNATSAVRATADKSDFLHVNAPIYRVGVDDAFMRCPLLLAESVLCRFSGTCHADSSLKRR